MLGNLCLVGVHVYKAVEIGLGTSNVATSKTGKRVQIRGAALNAPRILLIYHTLTEARGPSGANDLELLTLCSMRHGLQCMVT